MSPGREAELLCRHPWVDVPMECGDGWFDVLDSLLHEVGPARLTQVKQKLGRLRVYGEELDAGQRARVEEAELASGAVCQVCGQADCRSCGADRVRGRCAAQEVRREG